MIHCITAKPLQSAQRQTVQGSDAAVRSYTIDKSTSVSLFTSIHQVSKQWDGLAPPGQMFLSSRYFAFLESNTPKGFAFGYLLFYRDDKPIGIAYCQWAPFSGQRHLDHSSMSSWKRWLLSRISISILFCGNMMLTGQNGFAFHKSIGSTEQARLLRAALDKLLSDHSLPERKAKMWVIKDVPQDQTAHFDALSSCTGFTVQPGMEISLDDRWNSFDDYLDNLASKYRVRAKRAMRRMKGVDLLPLNRVRHTIFGDDLHHLYRQVAAHSGFNMVELPNGYFENMSEFFGEDFQAMAFTSSGEIIGFYTLVRSAPNHLDAHYLGFSGEENRSRQLYLNMLFEMIKAGIEMKVSTINFSRTALEIKSSVGAKPTHYRLYARHSCGLINAMFPFWFQKFVPAASWEERHPFGK